MREGSYICEVLTVLPPEWPCPDGRKPARPEAEDIEYEVPPGILQAGPLARDFIDRKLAAERRILAGLRKSREPDRQREELVKRRIFYLKSLKEGV